MNAEYTFVNVYPRAVPGQRATTRLDGRLLGLAVGSLLLVTLAALLYLSQASVAARLRFQLQSYNGALVKLTEAQAVLRCRIAAADSQTALAARAQQIGLVPAPANVSYVYCDVPATAGSAPTPARTIAPGETQVVQHKPTLIERLTAFFARKSNPSAVAAKP